MASQVSFTGSIEADVEGMITDDTRLIWIETPSNPTLSGHGYPGSSKLSPIGEESQVVVDNTFNSPWVSNPLSHGADIVIHSVTKYINGHSDVVMGCAAFNSDQLWDRLSFLLNAIGCVPSPFDCWLAQRGLKTLHLRARQASLNALQVARALEASPNIVAVNYPGLPSHRQHKIVLEAA